MSEYIIWESDKTETTDNLGVKHSISHFEKREEIVRCRDCKHNELQTVVYSNKPLSVCTAEWCEGSEGDHPLVEPDGFCAWGEREDGDAR